jgi:hypothetical protein
VRLVKLLTDYAGVPLETRRDDPCLQGAPLIFESGRRLIVVERTYGEGIVALIDPDGRGDFPSPARRPLEDLELGPGEDLALVTHPCRTSRAWEQTDLNSSYVDFAVISRLLRSAARPRKPSG